MITVDQLQLLEESQKRHLKKMYNYGLATMREASEMEEDLQDEYRWLKYHPDSLKQALERQQVHRLKYGRVK